MPTPWMMAGLTQPQPSGSSAVSRPRAITASASSSDEEESDDQRSDGDAFGDRKFQQPGAGEHADRRAQRRQQVAPPYAAPGLLPQGRGVQRVTGEQQGVGEGNGQEVRQRAAQEQQAPGHGLELLGHAP